MNKYLTIVAKIEAEADKIEYVKSALLKLVRLTLEEAGCIRYDLHQDNNDPAVFLFYEIWESRAHWQDHMKSAHITEHREVNKGAIASSTVYEMTKI